MTERPEPGFVFMVFHYPEPGRAEALAQSMREMGAHLTGQPGLIEVEGHMETAKLDEGHRQRRPRRPLGAWDIYRV